MPLQGALLTAIIPRALPWAKSFCPFKAYWVISAVQFKRLQELMVGIGKLWVEEALYVDHGGLYS
nr:hypothetical protein [uncultured Prevotella sp.]